MSCDHSGLVPDLTDGRNVAPLERLVAHIAEASALPLNPLEEERFFSQAVADARGLLSQLRDTFAGFAVSPLLVDCALDFHTARQLALHGADHATGSVSEPPSLHWFSPHAALSAFELEDLLSHALQLPRKPRFVDLLHLAALPPAAFAERPVIATGLFAQTQAAAPLVVLGEVFGLAARAAPRRALSQIGDALRLATDASVLRLLEPLYLQGVYDSALRLDRLAAHVARVFAQHSAPPRTKAEEARRGRLSLPLVLQLGLLVAQYPVELPGGAALLQHLRRLQLWKQRVAELDVEAQAPPAHDDARRSSQRSGAKKAPGGGQNINLMEVEALLREAELWPFAFADELAVLARRKEQALEWIARFKSLFSQKAAASSRSARQSDAEPQEEGHKATLDELRLLISQGGSLLGEGPADEAAAAARAAKKQTKGLQRDMDRAVSAVEEAEDWIDRFRGLITDFFSNAAFLARPADMAAAAAAEAAATEAAADTAAEAAAEAADAVAGGAAVVPPPSADGFAHWDAVVAFERDVEDKRAALVEEIDAFLGEAQELPIVIEEAQVLELQLQVLRWAVAVRPLLLRQLHPAAALPPTSKRPPRVKPAEFNSLRAEINRYVSVSRLCRVCVSSGLCVLPSPCRVVSCRCVPVASAATSRASRASWRSRAWTRSASSPRR